MCIRDSSDGTLSAEFQQTLSDRAKEDKKVQKILADSRNYPVSMLELLAKNAEKMCIRDRKESMSLQSARDLWTQNFLSGAGNLKIRSKK